ncbi:MAG: BspA family leucine-rich repeat surface protein [Bacilli bacterium]|nr:BspA family leucine-rich repeat surface protein [Bacilli bacterium]
MNQNDFNMQNNNMHYQPQQNMKSYGQVPNYPQQPTNHFNNNQNQDNKKSNKKIGIIIGIVIVLIIAIVAIVLIFNLGKEKAKTSSLGCHYDGELIQGAEYVNGQYTYRYIGKGWYVELTDKDSKAPVTTKLCTSINGEYIIDMRLMFSDSKATSLYLSSFDTSNVTNMSDMFNGSQATSLDLSSFDTSNVTNMHGMFIDSQVTSLDLSSFDTSNVTNIGFMFADSKATIGYAKTQSDADRFNSTENKPEPLVFVTK